MRFRQTKVAGAVFVGIEPKEDERGFFARVFCEDELRAAGIDPRVVQSSVSYNKRRGTLRGLHYQAPPGAENKLVSCPRGSIYDVVVDLRPASPTYRRWDAAILSGTNFDALFIPQGCAHGFLTLEDETVVRYDISERHAPDLARGARYDDPAFGVVWPEAPVVVAARDLGYPPFGDPA